MKKHIINKKRIIIIIISAFLLFIITNLSIKIKNFYETKNIYDEFIAIFRYRQFVNDKNDPLYEDSEYFKEYTDGLDYKLFYPCPFIWRIKIDGDTGYIDACVRIDYYDERYDYNAYQYFPSCDRYIIKMINGEWKIVGTYSFPLF